MRSKEIFTENDRTRQIMFSRIGQSSEHDSKMYNALMIAEAEIEELREKLHIANTEISGLSESSKLKKVTIWCKSNENEDYCPFYYFLTEKEVDDFVEENELCDRSSYEIETFIGSNIYKQALNKNK